ncbi:thiol reductant ABC exporter subunit CydD [Subtercola endophyticus]|uniref:thiol reductant ABC exporter subunit CydD n=1 Tax=Subtercola endophyticus TaxID=2895559 RepID=UPI001E4523C1|nr:thiol reductant ABC exporter subunit CydD [Subtercola endophyticus]UFS60763.1 thiol reductant ABC exporter subunit CydD [Subtercola endophyticus]
MKPVDKRLLQYASAARSFFGLGAVLGLAQVACIVAFAWLVSSIVVDAIGGAPLSALGLRLAALALVVLVRSGLVWLMEYNSARGATVVKSQLRREVLTALPRLGPSWLSTRNSVAVSTVATSGLDALDTYFSKYLPQLILTALATPILVVVLFSSDWLSGLTVLLTLPVIPVFMVLIGWATQKAQAQQWKQLGRLSSGFLDVVEGLSTLKVFGREKRQAERIRSVTDDYRVTTMKVLRMSFVSGFALELAASLAVALVAVSIGLRLVDGSLGLGVGLFVLMLAPEVFLPLRQVGAQFHAAADGVAATDDVFEILDAAAGVAGVAGAGSKAAAAAGALTALAAVDARGGASVRAGASGGDPAAGVHDRSEVVRDDSVSGLLVDRLSVRYGDDPVVREFSAAFARGTLSVIAGPSGAGKSSLLAAMLGFVEFDGRIELVGSGHPVALSRDDVAWAGQRPGLMAGTVAANVTLGSSALHAAHVNDAHVADAHEADAPHVAAHVAAHVAGALRRAGAAELDASTVLGVNGAGLSGGQAQRVAVARALYRAGELSTPLLLLDEPSSALDAGSEAALIDGLREVAASGVIVIVVSHRRAFQEAADQVVVMSPVAAPADTPAAPTPAAALAAPTPAAALASSVPAASLADTPTLVAAAGARAASAATGARASDITNAPAAAAPGTEAGTAPARAAAEVR